MMDRTPKMTETDINMTEKWKSLNSDVTEYELNSIPKGKAKPIVQTERFRHGYITHTKHPLSMREARFIDEYMACGDGAIAVEKAGFTCKNKASKANSLLRKDYIC